MEGLTGFTLEIDANENTIRRLLTAMWREAEAIRYESEPHHWSWPARLAEPLPPLPFTGTITYRMKKEMK